MLKTLNEETDNAECPFFRNIRRWRLSFFICDYRWTTMKIALWFKREPNYPSFEVEISSKKM